MRRNFLIGTLAIALFAVGGMLLTSWLTRDEPAVVIAQPPVSDPVAAQPRAAVVLPERLPPVQAAAQGSTASIAESAKLAASVNAPPGTARGSKVFRPMATRRAPRGATNGLMAGLGSLQPRVAGCANGSAVGGSSGRAADSAVLVLDLEQLNGKVKVVDASVHSRGRLNDATVACAKEAIVGQVLVVAEARPGQHLRVPYPLRF